MSIYIGNDLEDRLEALEMENTSLKDTLKLLEIENASLKKSDEYHKFVHEINHMSDLHLDSSFYKQSMKLDDHVKIKEWPQETYGKGPEYYSLNSAFCPLLEMQTYF